MSAREQLRGWREALTPLVDEVAAALLPWVERLALAVGPLAEAEPEPGGDPDGFAGLGRRGSYERLLPTEWLLATEAPDEFVRRAAAGEHAFFELARRREAGSRVTAVFFDAGPAQIGAPRLAHLALLLLFARRAETSAARFFWGVAQKPGVLREVVTPEQGQMLLEGRSRVALDAQLVKLVREAKELRDAGRELWLVGGPQVRVLAPGPFIEIVEPLEREPTRLLARVRRPDRGEVEIALPLPSPEMQLRLLRDPFVRAAPPPRRRETGGTKRWRFPRVDGQGALFFGSNGRRLVVELEGGLAAYAVPNSPHAQPVGEPMVHETRAGDRVVAACWEKNRATLLLEDKEGGLRLQMVGRRGGPSGPSARVEHAIDDDALLPRSAPGLGGTGAASAVLELRPLRDSFRYVVRDPEGHWGQLAGMTSGPGKLAWTYRHQGANVVALEDVNFSVLLAGWSREETISPELFNDSRIRSVHTIEVREVRGDGSLGESRLEIQGERVLFGYAEPADQHPRLGLCAVERPLDGEWLVHCRQAGADRAGTVAIKTPPTGTVVGVHHNGQVPLLVVLDEEATRLSLQGAGVDTTLAKTRTRIVKVATCTMRHLFAYLCEDGQLVVRSHAHEHPLLQEHHDAG